MHPAEQLSTCLNLSAADVPCKTAPFASFSGRTEKEGPARPERGPIYEVVLVHFDKTISLFQQAEAVQRLHSLPVCMDNNQLLQRRMSAEIFMPPVRIISSQAGYLRKIFRAEQLCGIDPFFVCNTHLDPVFIH